MKNQARKRGQKFFRKFSRASIKAGEESKEHIKENLVERFTRIADIKLLILEWSLLVGALIMLAGVQAFWFGDSYAEDVFVEGGSYTEATLGDVSSMNPLFATTSSERVLSRLMFATLSNVDYTGHFGIGLAESIRPNEDAKVWTVKLREGLKWSDGEPITRDDVLFTVNLIKNPVVNSVYDTNLKNVKVTEGENGEIIFTLPTTYTDFIAALNFPIVPKHALGEADPKTLVENSFSTAPITSGPFNYNAVQAASSTTNNEKIYYLSANPDYYQGKVMLNSFAIHTYATKEGIVRAINSGEVSATAELSGAEDEEIVTGQFNKKLSSLNSGAFIFFNTAKETVKNAELRAAIRQGIDLEKIRAVVPDTLALNYPLLEAQIKLGHYPEIPARDFEAAKAKTKELMGENELHLDIATVNSGYLPGVADAVKTELESLGIKADVTAYDENQEFINNVIGRRNYDILVYEVELGVSPDLLPYYHSSQANATGLNLANYRNALADDLLLGARDTVDNELRVKKFESFLEYWVTGVPAIGLYQPNLTYYYNKNVRTFSNDVRLVTALDRFSDIDDWAATKAVRDKTP